MPPFTLFCYCFLHYVLPRIYILGPSHYPVNTKSPLFTLFQYCFLHWVPSITPSKPNPPFHYFPVRPVLLSPLDPSHYSVKTNPPSVPPSLLSLFPYNLSSCLLPPPFPSFPVLLS